MSRRNNDPCGIGCGYCVWPRRVGFRVEGVADVARRRWRMVLRLGKYATIRVALFGT